ncbi:MAG: hypothetical protein JW839_05015 [Candidatus Lokiarchaeota archaeon]|nr:hypothetical protein [Candidatus Lokiarchaeota archaeon]
MQYFASPDKNWTASSIPSSIPSSWSPAAAMSCLTRSAMRVKSAAPLGWL